MKQGKPKPIRFAEGDEKRIKMYAIATDRSFSAAVRDLCNRGLASVDEEISPPPTPLRPMRRMLSRGVGP